MAPTAIDLFAGPGGMTQGLKDAGFRVVASVESDALAAKTYLLNHPEVAVRTADIRSVDPAQLMRSVGLKPGDLDLCAGCPPCQGFSSVRTLNGKVEIDDARNDLISEYFRFVRSFEPKAIMLENVPGLLGDARYEALVGALEDLGYPAREGTRILNAADFGVPQSRRRLVLMCVRYGNVVLAPAGSQRRSVRDAIGSLPAAGTSGDPLHDMPEHRSERVRAIIAAIPKDGGSRADLPEDQVLACHKDFNGFKDVYGRMSWTRPAPTITGGCHNPSKGRFLHPDEPRAITLREAALLQGFPPRYQFSLDRGKLAIAAMIGNAVPPPLAAAQSRALRS